MAITVDFGACEKCAEKNSKAARIFRKCGAPLPWTGLAQAANKKVEAPLQNSSANILKDASPKISAPQVSSGFVTQSIGCALFVGGIAYFAARMTGSVPYIPYDFIN